MQIALLGCGNMGSALIKGMAQDELASDIHLFNPTKAKAQQLATQMAQARVLVHDHSAAAVAEADIIILAMKPYGIMPTLSELKTVIEQQNPLIVSIAAGVSLASMEALLPDSRIIRLMPNTPVEVGQGASGLVRGSKVLDEDVQHCIQLMSQSGLCVELKDEEHIHLVMALAGCAPAYFYELLDVMGQFGLAHGIDLEDSLKLASQAMIGAARLQQVTGERPTVLRNAVTSPNGVTLAALRRLNALHVKESWMETLEAAVSRSLEMEKENA